MLKYSLTVACRVSKLTHLYQLCRRQHLPMDFYNITGISSQKLFPSEAEGAKGHEIGQGSTSLLMNSAFHLQEEACVYSSFKSYTLSL